jgi:hypothetical protein
VAGCCEHGDERSDFIEGGSFLDLLPVSFSRKSVVSEVS